MKVIQPSDVANNPIPNKLSELAKSPTARKARITTSKDLWVGFMSKDQRKGLSQKDEENLLLTVAQQWNLRWPLSQVHLY